MFQEFIKSWGRGSITFNLFRIFCQNGRKGKNNEIHWKNMKLS